MITQADYDALIAQLGDDNDPNIDAEPEPEYDDYADIALPLDHYDDLDLS